MSRTFQLTDEGHLESVKFIANHSCPIEKVGAVGGAVTYSFTDTSLGQIQLVVCTCGASRDLTDYSEW